MGLAAEEHRDAGSSQPPAVVVWHDLECGLYRADLPLWRELAEDARGGSRSARVLDVGAGTGRVSLDLARAGQELTAIDLDAQLLGALERRAAESGLAVRTLRADARSFGLADEDFALCLVPMQTLQLLGGEPGRVSFFARARAHLRPGALIACAIVTELEPFDCYSGDRGPSPEVARVGELEYVSRATSLQLSASAIRIEREREIRRIDRDSRAIAPAGSANAPETERDVIELDRVSAPQLRREGLDAGLSYVGVRAIAATTEHVGSEAVILRV